MVSILIAITFLSGLMPAFVVDVANLFGGSYVTVGCFNLSVSQLNAITESITL